MLQKPMYEGGQGVQAPHPHTSSISKCCLVWFWPHITAPLTILPTSLQLHPGLQGFIYILNIEISFIEEITLTASRGRGFPVVKILGRACNEWRWDLWAEDFLQQPSIPHLSEIGQLLQFRRVRMHTLWNGALISLFCHSANHFPCTSF